MSKTILILTSTLPRWEHDNVPPFVLDLAKNISQYSNYQQILVAPHFRGAKTTEYLQNNIVIRRIRYAWPSKLQTIFYGGGAANKKHNLLFVLLTITFVASLFINTIYLTLRNNIHTIHAHWLMPQGLVAVIVGKIFRKKVVVTVHGGDVFTMNGRIGKKLKKIVLKNADVVATNSSITTEACKGIYPQRKYIFGPMGAKMKNVSVKRKVTKNTNLLFVGRITKEKGVPYLIEAMQILSNDYKLFLVGDGPQKEVLENQVAKLGLINRVEFTGWINHSQLNDYYEMADIFIGPSITLENGWREAMGLVYLEALEHGVPVITTDTTGAKDFVREGINGAIVPEKNPHAIVAAIDDIMSKPKNIELFETELKQVKKLYAWGVCAKRYIKVYGANS